MKPDVSILIPTKDRPDRLKVAVASALAQGAVEVIVQDGSAKKAKDLPDDDRLKYFWRPDKSIANAVNMAAEEAVADVFHFACDDDEMRPGAVASALTALAWGAKWTYGQIQIVRGADTTPGLVTRHGDRVKPGEYMIVGKNGQDPWDPLRLAKGNYVPQPATFWTREAWDVCGPFDETLPLCFDYEMWARLGSRWEPTVRDHVDAFYVEWPGSTSVHSQHLQIAEVVRLQRRWLEWGFGRREGE